MLRSFLIVNRISLFLSHFGHSELLLSGVRIILLRRAADVICALYPGIALLGRRLLVPDSQMVEDMLDCFLVVLLLLVEFLSQATQNVWFGLEFLSESFD